MILLAVPRKDSYEATLEGGCVAPMAQSVILCSVPAAAFGMLRPVPAAPRDIGGGGPPAGSGAF
jgi:hypothetical protein